MGLKAIIRADGQPSVQRVQPMECAERMEPRSATLSAPMDADVPGRSDDLVMMIMTRRSLVELERMARALGVKNMEVLNLALSDFSIRLEREQHDQVNGYKRVL